MGILSLSVTESSETFQFLFAGCKNKFNTTMTIKICNCCRSSKPISEFYTKTKVAGGKKYLNSNCKKCECRRTKSFYSRFARIKKQNAVDYKGGKCSRCGYNRCLTALEFHHRNPKEKDPKLKQFCRRTLNQKIKQELDNCDLVCANCHREIHELNSSNGRKRLGE